MKMLAVSIAIFTMIIVLATGMAYIVEYWVADATIKYVDRGVYAAANAGFLESRLDELAYRHDSTSRQKRDIMLDTSLATRLTEEYLRENLGLNDYYMPTNHSRIRAGELVGGYIKAVNKLPVEQYIDGQKITKTTIYVKVSFPVFIRGQKIMIQRTYYISADSFLIDSQL